MNLTVDLNADLGESAGCDLELLELVTSANIACGFHAGTPDSILRSILDARKRHVSVGAHPSFLDRENFGRAEIALPSSEIFAQVTYQLGAFAALVRAGEASMAHVKPHGALYNMAARDDSVADAIVRAICDFDSSLILFAPGNSALARVGASVGLRVVSEVFADRNYLANGALVSRNRTDALLRDPDQAASRVLRMLRESKVRSVDGGEVAVRAETICIHGDTAGSVDFARELRRQLLNQGVVIAAPKSPG